MENGILTITYEIPLHTNLKNAVSSYINTNEPLSDASLSPEPNEYSDELPILLIADDNASIRSVLKDIFKIHFFTHFTYFSLFRHRLWSQVLIFCLIDLSFHISDINTHKDFPNR